MVDTFFLIFLISYFFFFFFGNADHTTDFPKPSLRPVTSSPNHAAIVAVFPRVHSPFHVIILYACSRGESVGTSKEVNLGSAPDKPIFPIFRHKWSPSSPHRSPPALSPHPHMIPGPA